MQAHARISDVQIAVGMNELEEESMRQLLRSQEILKPSFKDKTDRLVVVAAMVAGPSGGVTSPGLADQRWLQGAARIAVG